MQYSAKEPQFVSYAQIFCCVQAIGSRPLHSGHSPQLWLQWITTSSPGCQRVTPGPTRSTMPEASEPAMWKSYPVYRKIETGRPIDAQTPL